jgi:hypothetical protein
MQNLLGLDLDEIAAVLHNEDRLAGMKIAYHDVRADEKQRKSILEACLSLQLETAGHSGVEAGRHRRVSRRPRRPHLPNRGPAQVAASWPRISGVFVDGTTWKKDSPVDRPAPYTTIRR